MIEPTETGPSARAWKFVPEPGPTHAALAVWLIDQPRVHPFWSRWVINLIHLRDAPGLPEAKRHFPEATHEITIAALDPASYEEHEQIQVGTFPSGWKWMNPLDLLHQFNVPSDQMAIRIVELAVHACCVGDLAADTDFREVWKTLIDGTADHYRSGRHAIS